MALTDHLEGEGLTVPELSPAVQQRLRDLGMPERASTKNPVDMGATGFTHLAVESLVDMGRITLASGEVDALIFHGLGRAAMDPAEKTPSGKKSMLRMEEDVLVGYSGLQAELGRPVMIQEKVLFSQIGSSPAVHDLS